MDEFLGLAIGLTGISGIIGMLVGKEEIAGELLVLCLILIVVGLLWWSRQKIEQLWRQLWDGRR